MKLNIRTRLAAAFGVVLVLACSQGGYALSQIHAVKANADAVTSNWMPSVALSNDMETKAADYRIGMLRLILSEPETRAALAEEVRKTGDQLADMDRAYVALISGDEERALHEKFIANWSAYQKEAGHVIGLAVAGQTEDARSIVLTKMPGLMNDVRVQLKAIVDLNEKGAANETANIANTYAMALRLCLTTMALMLVVSLTMAWRIAQDMSRRMQNAVRTADQITEGDLSQTAEIQGSDEITDLQHALARMQQQLADVVGEVRMNADSVATASAQIATGNADLSGRTEQQASALEETAASMEEINVTARLNADNASQANQLALNANEVARGGGAVVSEVVATMQQIEQASREIVEIIGVIDSIAFQTNILALNAAVEAARAGEQGRGFAVVAGEVRTLAQRSADAAKQIKTLIGTSVERVEQGTALADKAGGSMKDIVSAIQRVGDIVGEIASASREQMAGVGQVSEAVSQMDQATQQNAALVEESAAAAESLRDQAGNLVKAVAVFKLLERQGQQAPKAAASTFARKAPEHRIAQRPVPKAQIDRDAAMETGWAVI